MYCLEQVPHRLTSDSHLGTLRKQGAQAGSEVRSENDSLRRRSNNNTGSIAILLEKGTFGVGCI
jgi:hypothetical protein